MVNLKDIFDFDEDIELVQTTNYIQHMIKVSRDLLYILENLDNKDFNKVLFSFINLKFNWSSQFESFGIKNSSSSYIIKQLMFFDFIKPTELKNEEQFYLEEELQIHPRNIAQIRPYTLTSKGKNYILSNEIKQNLDILVDKKFKKDIISEKYRRENFFMEVEK